MEFRILGPLEVLHEGQKLAVDGSRERALLALLLLSANRVVSSERLAEDLWAGRPTEGAVRAIKVYVSRLRKVLREAGAEGSLMTRAPGYLVEIDRDALDAARFEILVAKGREQAVAGEHAAAAATLREALALWRGPALVDVSDAPFARAEAARLEEARLSALEDRIEADLACGRHRELVPELESITRAHPLREHLWAMRMLALYRSGRQAEALRAYQELRGMLGEELGLEPSAPLRQLERAILRQELDLSLTRIPEPEAPAAGVAVFLFSDLVGSTELLADLGDDGAEDLRRTHFSLLRRAVADAGGQEVKSLGDGLMVAFASPMAALACAVAMQQVIAEHNATSPEQSLSVRIGLHVGEPVRAEDDFFGTAVVVAKRLCDRAEGAQILASDLLVALVGSRGGFRFRPLGRLPVKGLPEPVGTVAVEWRSEGTAPGQDEAPGPVPLPPFLAEVGRVFVGREAELDRLRATWKEAGAGGRRFVLVGGEPGVGKTRLAAALAGEVYAEEALVLAGRCGEDLGVPYQPLVEALSHFVDHSPDANLASRLGRFAGELVRLTPELAERVPGLPPPLRSDPETERYRLFDALAAWLSVISRDTPLLLVLDDLQWAAKPTLLLLRHILRSEAAMRLLVLGTYRDTELSPTHPLTDLLADLRRGGLVERIPLSGLDETGVLAVMEQAAGHDLDEEERQVARAIHEETEGNPFFVWEVLRHLAETGGVVQRDGRWTAARPVAELGIPEGVRDVVGGRLSRLAEETRRMLAVGAAAGTEFDLPVLQVATGFEEDALLAALDEAIGTRLVAEVPGGMARYAFAHALVRATLYDHLSAARRTTFHRRLAEAIELVHTGRLDDHLPALAHHFARGAAPGSQEMAKAVVYATRAGDHALAQLAHDEAVNYYRQALQLLERGPEDQARRLELLISLGEAQRRAGDSAHRETLLHAGRLAREMGDPESCARAALANQRGLFSQFFAVDLERVAALEEALEAIGPSETRTRARILASLAGELYFAGDDRRHGLGSEALAIARRLGEESTLAQVLAVVWSATWDPAELKVQAGLVTELVELAHRLGDQVLEFHGGIALFLTAMQQGDVGRADAGLEMSGKLAEELSQPVLRWRVLYTRANRAMAAGRFDEAERLAEEALRLGEAVGQPDAAFCYHVGLVTTRLLEGRFEEAAPMCEQFQRAMPFRGALAWAYGELDRVDEARAIVDDLRPQRFAAIPRDHTWLITLGFLARACSRLPDREAASELYELLLPHRSEVVVFHAGWNGPVSHDLGLLATTLGRYEEAGAHFGASTEILDRIDSPAWLAHTRVEWARMLLTRRQPGDTQRSEELLGQAFATARELGLANIERRAAELLTGVSDHLA